MAYLCDFSKVTSFEARSEMTTLLRVGC